MVQIDITCSIRKERKPFSSVTNMHSRIGFLIIMQPVSFLYRLYVHSFDSLFPGLCSNDYCLIKPDDGSSRSKEGTIMVPLFH